MTTSARNLSKNPFDDIDVTNRTLRPLWSISDFSDDKKVLTWLKETVEYCDRYYAAYFNVQCDNLLLYRGIQWFSDSSPAALFDRLNYSPRRVPRIVINHCYDAVEHHVSKLTRYRPAVSIRPANAEQEDADDAKVSKDVLDYIWYKNEIDRKNAELVRLAKITGEGFRFITWDPQKGDVHPDWIKASIAGQRIPLTDSEGLPISSTKGDPIYIQSSIKTGDVSHDVYPGYHIFEEPCSRRENINWAIRWDSVHVDTLKAKYPDYAHKIKPGQDFVEWGEARYHYSRPTDNVTVYELWHRSTEFLEKGRYIKFTKECVLENTELPYSHGKLPYIYLSDIDLPDQIRGMSFFQQVFPIQHQINAIASLIYKAMVLFAHPKWAMLQNSCDVQQLLNDSTIISYSEQAPQLISSNMIPGDVFNYLGKLEEMFSKLSGQYTLSTGAAPSGVRAAKALRVIEEQEDKRAYYMAIKYNNIALVEDAKMSISVAGDMYDDSDGRLARVVGKNNEYRIRGFKAANLSKPYDIRIENTTAFSQSPAARIEEINEMAMVRLDPQAPVTREQYFSLLNLGALDEFKDVATKAFECAKSENEDMLRGEIPSDPIAAEELIVHWRTHLQQMQGREYKELLPLDRKQIFERHLYITEYLMWEKGYGIMNAMGQFLAVPSPIFRQQMDLQCPQFPVVFKIPPPGLQPQLPAPIMGGTNMPQPSPVGPNQLSQAPIDSGMSLDLGAPVATPPPGASLSPGPLPT